MIRIKGMNKQNTFKCHRIEWAVCSNSSRFKVKSNCFVFVL